MNHIFKLYYLSKAGLHSSKTIKTYVQMYFFIKHELNTDVSKSAIAFMNLTSSNSVARKSGGFNMQP
jgi:hypothetical protein